MRRWVLLAGIRVPSVIGMMVRDKKRLLVQEPPCRDNVSMVEEVVIKVIRP